MNKSLIFSILCIFVAKVTSKKALIFNLKTQDLADVCRNKGDQKCPACLTACPAFTPHEQQFNKNMSLSKKSVFSRIIYAEDEYAKNIVADFCEKTVKPVVLFNSENNKYEIGYELYFEGKVNVRAYVPYHYYREYTYHHYKPVNTKDLDNYEVLNLTIPLNDSLIVRYEAGKDMKFKFTDGSRILVFKWIKVLSVQSSKYQKRIKFEPSYDFSGRKIKNLPEKCENYPSDNDDLYSKKNQKKFLKDIPVPLSFDRNNADMECGHPYGCLEKSQIMSLWFFESSLARLASCSHMNVIPVWTSIARQLRKVDLYIASILKHVSEDPIVYFGVSGALKVPQAPSSVHGTPQKHREMYLRAPKFENRKVTIPRIIYRIIEITLCFDYYDNQNYYAVIIIHNDPTADPKTDKLCINDTLSGWGRITNNDPRTGFSYVCPMTEEIKNQIGTFDSSTEGDIEPLDLDRVPHKYGACETCEGCRPVDFENKTDDINEYFDDLMQQFL